MRAAAVVAQTRAELALTLRRGESLLVTFGIPAGVLVFFAGVDVIDVGVGRRIDFLVPGVLALAVMSTAMVSLGIATGFERRYGVLKRLGTTPLGRGALLTAKTANVVCIEMVQVAVIALAGRLLGWHPGGRPVVAAMLLIVGTVAFAGLGLLMAGALRAELTLALANGLYIAFLLLGGVAVPLDRLPGAVEAVARLLPVTALTETVRAALTSGAAMPAGSVAVLIAWAVITPLLAAAAFRWEE